MSEPTPDNRDELMVWLEDWIENDDGLGLGVEILYDIVERPDAHEAEIEMLLIHDDTHMEIADALERGDPQDWGYPAEGWSDVERIRECRMAGLSHMQAIVHVWKRKDMTHEEIAEQTGIPKGTIDVHSRRLGRKVREAKELLRAVGGR